MSGEMEAAGAAVTAGLAAGAIEKGEGHGADAHGACSNCGTELHGKYCTECGQPAHIHRTLGHMVEEFLHGIIHFDTRAWRTLPLLIFRPGTLTREYIHGKRARYISPLAMFLLVIFTMFAVFAFSGGPAVGVNPELDLELSRPAAVTADAPADTPSDGGATPGNYKVDPKGDVFAQIRDAYARGDITVNTGWPDLDKKIKKKLENPELAFYKIQNAAYKFAFLLVPISLPFVWLLFILISLIAGWGVLNAISPWWIFAIPIHAYFQMKGGYNLGWFSALWRTPVLMVFASFGLVLFLVAITMVGVVG